MHLLVWMKKSIKHIMQASKSVRVKFAYQVIKMNDGLQIQVLPVILPTCSKYKTNGKEVNEHIVVGDGKRVICQECKDVCMQNKVTNEKFLLKNVL